VLETGGAGYGLKQDASSFCTEVFRIHRSEHEKQHGRRPINTPLADQDTLWDRKPALFALRPAGAARIGDKPDTGPATISPSW